MCRSLEFSTVLPRKVTRTKELQQQNGRRSSNHRVHITDFAAPQKATKPNFIVKKETYFFNHLIKPIFKRFLLTLTSSTFVNSDKNYFITIFLHFC